MLLPAMLDEFPFLHVSPQTAHSMWNKQARHLSSFLKSGAEAKRTKTQRMIEEAEKRQEALVGILKKDLDHNLRMVRRSVLSDTLLENFIISSLTCGIEELSATRQTKNNFQAGEARWPNYG